ncbi:DUF1641 domain-containing protein [Ferrimicrobium sp.]|uniref:DUF1641 domain-containing protein n=1 Tax=Ferrimicrobium sp. TaxID=2926050 RepID=UPI00260AB74A|nr:DUF1641 domain-containing protein [Ferrimicrobium sp.]
MATNLGERINADELDVLLDRLTDPETAAYALGIIENLEALYLLTLSLNEFLRRGEVIVDSLSSSVAEIRQSSTKEAATRNFESLKEFVALFKSLGDRSEVLGSILRNQLLDEDFLGGVTVLTQSLGDARRSTKGSRTSKIKGLGSLVKSLKDVEVQRGLDFAVELLRALGRNNTGS